MNPKRPPLWERLLSALRLGNIAYASVLDEEQAKLPKLSLRIRILLALAFGTCTTAALIDSRESWGTAVRSGTIVATSFLISGYLFEKHSRSFQAFLSVAVLWVAIYYGVRPGHWTIAILGFVCCPLLFYGAFFNARSQV